MAFLRFSRDKRGYENFYLIQPTNRRGKTPRLLYWFRTPPNVKVGREPFDADARRALEAQNPDISFDWTAIAETPIPPVVETERWRERRRLERASRQSAPTVPDEDEIADVAQAAPRPTAAAAPASPESAERAVEEPGGEAAQDASASMAGAADTPTEAEPGGRQASRGRRRRRRGRRGPSQGPGTVLSASADEATAEPSSSEGERSALQESGESSDDGREP